ncbi:hypothetical protein ALP29_200353 [Pseudomonas syringae pv. avii]|uniref:Uncharacterized protein n=1 Tax=Pseudomonas syringae pv. avii TaxID=663959 RepID=A0A3M5VF23_PSESX|nr:hypothetical protein ALP29_200353 [Pseudomonas syringae pv. avii]
MFVCSQAECQAGTLHTRLPDFPGQALFWQVDKQRASITLAERVVQGAVLTCFVIRHITDKAAVIGYAIGKHQRFALQALRNTHFTQPHGAEDQPVGSVRQHQVDILVGGRVAQQVEDKHVPACLLRGLLD